MFLLNISQRFGLCARVSSNSTFLHGFRPRLSQGREHIFKDAAVAGFDFSTHRYAGAHGHGVTFDDEFGFVERDDDGSTRF